MIKFCLSNHFDIAYRYQLNRLRALDPLTERAIVIVPEQATVQAERELIDHLDVKGLMHIDVLSFSRAVHKLLQDTPYDEKAALSDLGKRLLLSDIVDQVGGELEIYAGANNKKGFLDQLADIISDFRHQSIEIEDLQSLCDGAEKGIFVKKLDEIATIYAAYLRRLNDVTFDEDSLISSALEQLKKTRAFADHIVVVSGFSSMTGSEQQLLIALAQQARETYIHVVVDDEREVDEYAREFLEGLWQKLPDDAYGVETDCAARRQSVLAFKSIFDGSCREGGILCYAADDRRTELDAVFIDMIKNYQNGHCSWRDMAIVSNQLANYHRLIERLAKIYQVPIFIDGRRPAITHYIVDFILSLLRAILYNYRTRDVVKALKTGFFDLSDEVVWRVENYALAYDLRGAEWFAAWREDEADLFSAVSPILNQLKRFQQLLAQAKSAQLKIDALRGFLDEMTVLQRIAEDVQKLYDDGDYQASEELAQVYNIIDGVFYQIYAMGEDAPMTLERFYELLKLGFESYEIGVIPQVQDAVVVGNIKRTRLPKLAAIYFVGMDEGAIPSAVQRAGLFNDDEMERLKAIGLNRLPTQVYSYREEVYKTYEHIVKAEVVKWYYAKMTTDGDLVKPSIWHQRLGEAAPASIDMADLLALNLTTVYAEKVIDSIAANEYSLADAEALKNHFGDGAAQRMAAAFSAGKAALNAADKLDPALVKTLYGARLDASVSRLESYAACPYQHFIRYGLRPRVEKEVSLDFLDVGDFYHKVIENVMNACAALSFEQLDEATLAHIYDKYYCAYVERHYRFRYNAKNRYFAERLKTVLATAVKQLVAQLSRGAFKRVQNEIGFDYRENGALPALQLSTEAVDVNLRGVIDRVDYATTPDGDYLRVVDYKSSTHKLDVNQVLHGLQLQLMIYLNAACHFAGGQSPAKPFGAFYFSVDEVLLNDDMAGGAASERGEDLLNAYKLDGVFVEDAALIEALDYSFEASGTSDVIDAKMTNKGLKASRQSVSAEDLVTLKDYALFKAAELAEQIYRGNIAIAPIISGRTNPCQYCLYRDICRFDDGKCAENYRRIDEHANADDVLAVMKASMCDEFDN